MVEICRH